MFPSHTNQSRALHRETIDWLLYGGGTTLKQVKTFLVIPSLKEKSMFIYVKVFKNGPSKICGISA